MSEALKKIQEYILYQEQWSRAALTSFSTTNLEKIEEVLEILPQTDYDQTLEICEQQIKNNKTSIYALYISGIIALETHIFNDEHLIRLLDIFTDQHKWNVVEHISNKILKYRNNLQALRHLAMVYEATNRSKELVPIWEQIVSIDYEEADILQKLAKKIFRRRQYSTGYKKAIKKHYNDI